MIPYGKQHITDSDKKAVMAVLESDFLTQGKQVPSFESAICDFCRSQHAVAVNSATSALHIACLALGVQKDDWVWTSPISFVASANCALYCGANIDFVDIDEGNMSIDALKEKLKKAKRKKCLPKVIIPVHLAGHCCDMAALAELAKEYHFSIIEDASHAIGGKYKHQFIGSCQYSDICVFSFHPVKIITSGEGGVATTNDEQLSLRMKQFRSHGLIKEFASINEVDIEFINNDEGDWYNEQQSLGFNYRMTELQGALGLSQLNQLEGFVTKRNYLATKYQEKLADLPLSIFMPEAGEINILSSWHLLIVKFDNKINRKTVFDKMRAADIQVHVHYYPIHLQPYYARLGFSSGDFPNAEDYYQHCLSLPLYPDLTPIQQDYIISTLRECLI